MLLLMTFSENLIVQEIENADILLQKIALGDKNAFRQFYEATKADVYSLALSFLKNTQDAEDIMQTVYIKVYDSARDYKPQGKPMAWVLTITKNLCYSKLRSVLRRGEFSDEVRYDTSSHDVDTEEKLLLEYCLKSLNDDERNIIVLHAVSGLKHREIAKLLGLPIGTVLSKYQRGLKKIKTFLQGGECDD